MTNKQRDAICVALRRAGATYAEPILRGGRPSGIRFQMPNERGWEFIDEDQLRGTPSQIARQAIAQRKTVTESLLAELYALRDALH